MFAFVSDKLSKKRLHLSTLWNLKDLGYIYTKYEPKRENKLKSYFDYYITIDWKISECKPFLVHCALVFQFAVKRIKFRRFLKLLLDVLYKNTTSYTRRSQYWLVVYLANTREKIASQKVTAKSATLLVRNSRSIPCEE